MNAAIKSILSDRPIAFHPVLARIGGGVKAGLLLSQLCYWDGRQSDQDGWIYKTEAEFEDETCLSRYEQAGARKELIEKGLIEIKRQGVPARLYYRVNHEGIEEAITQQQDARNCTTGCAKLDNKSSKKPQLSILTEITAENTQRDLSPPEKDIKGILASKRRDPGTEISEGIEYSAKFAEFYEKRINDGRGKFEFERWIAYHVKKGDRAKSWDGSWRTWVLNKIDFSRQRESVPQDENSAERQLRFEREREALRERRERRKVQIHDETGIDVDDPRYRDCPEVVEFREQFA